jgi:hypothetical protein
VIKRPTNYSGHIAQGVPKLEDRPPIDFEPIKKPQQTKIMSFVEACIQTVIGFSITLIAQYFIYKYFYIVVSWADFITIALLFTGISLIRSYIIRRIFNHL